MVDSASDDPGKSQDLEPWKLDPERFPRRVVLELPEPLLLELQELAQRSGRNLGEIVTAILDRQLHPRGFSDQEMSQDG